MTAKYESVINEELNTVLVPSECFAVARALGGKIIGGQMIGDNCYLWVRKPDKYDIECGLINAHNIPDPTQHWFNQKEQSIESND